MLKDIMAKIEHVKWWVDTTLFSHHIIRDSYKTIEQA